MASLLGISEKNRSAGLDGSSQLAGLERQRNSANSAMRDQKRSQTVSGIATGAGMGFSIGGPVGAAVGAGLGLLGSLF